VKIWLIIALCASSLALAGDGPPSATKNDADQKEGREGWAPAAPATQKGQEAQEADDINWMDNSHAYATEQAQALTEWMDNYFGDPDYDIERAESLLRLEWTNEWDEEDRYNTNVRLRGKLQLPRVSKRLNLVFSGEDGDELSEDERSREDSVGLLYNLGEKGRSRVDLTLGFKWDGLRPGIRYRAQGPLADKSRYRFTQRLQWETDEGFFTTGQVNLDRAITKSDLLRWSNRVVYGEETQGAEWRTRLSWRQRLRDLEKSHQFVVAYFGSINGATDPSLVKNYKLGVLLRRQVYRRYLFFELEPSYNLRKRKDDNQRKSMWALMLRFEIALERDLLHQR